MRDTPYLAVDTAVLDANIARMAAHTRALGVDLRPHAKTHKSPDIARRQRDAGAVGLTVATVAEAEVFAAAGFSDLFIAYPLWVEGPRAQRLARLLEEGVRLRVGVDSAEGVRMLAAATSPGSRSAHPLSVAVEIDCGHHRSGVPAEGAVPVATAIVEAGLTLAGVFTFPGHSYRPDGAQDAARDEEAALREARDRLREAGLPCPVVSGGSTPSAGVTGELDRGAGTETVLTELRPGVYPLGDAQQWELGTIGPDSIALTVVATVVSRRSDNDGTPVAILDAGSKVLASDRAAWATGHGRLLDAPDARITTLSEHHATVTFPRGTALPELGTRVRVAPNHVCTVVNLSDELIPVTDGVESAPWPVSARGANT